MFNRKNHSNHVIITSFDNYLLYSISGAATHLICDVSSRAWSHGARASRRQGAWSHAPREMCEASPSWWWAGVLRKFGGVWFPRQCLGGSSAPSPSPALYQRALSWRRKARPNENSKPIEMRKLAFHTVTFHSPVKNEIFEISKLPWVWNWRLVVAYVRR